MLPYVSVSDHVKRSFLCICEILYVQRTCLWSEASCMCSWTIRAFIGTYPNSVAECNPIPSFIFNSISFSHVLMYIPTKQSFLCVQECSTQKCIMLLKELQLQYCCSIPQRPQSHMYPIYVYSCFYRHVPKPLVCLRFAQSTYNPKWTNPKEPQSLINTRFSCIGSNSHSFNMCKN